MVVTRVRKECDRLKDINMSTDEVLEQEMKKAKKEELSRKRFQGALLDSSNELKLRKAERDKSMMENVMLKDELRNYRESKESLKEQLTKTEKDMLITIYQYKEKENLAAINGQVLRDEQAKVSALRVEKEAREEVIELLHEESMKWMDKFALTLNESQEFLKLLAKAQVMADVYSTPDEVHSLFYKYQHMIELMTCIIKNR